MKLSLHKKRGSPANIISLHEEVISSLNGSLLRISQIPRLKHHLYRNHHESVLSKVQQKKSEGKEQGNGNGSKADGYGSSVLNMKLTERDQKPEKNKFIVTSTMRKLSFYERRGISKKRKNGNVQAQKNNKNNSKTIDVSELMRVSSNARQTLFRNSQNSQYLNISNLINYGAKQNKQLIQKKKHKNFKRYTYVPEKANFNSILVSDNEYEEEAEKQDIDWNREKINEYKQEKEVSRMEQWHKKC